LTAALAELTDDQREAVLLRVVGEQSYDDVARKLGCTRETARVRVFRALERMRGRLGVTTGETTSNGGN
jgi:RNA polymerase sigma-70 factor (ECF subfamily)